jgi:hypothetical protein
MPPYTQAVCAPANDLLCCAASSSGYVRAYNGPICQSLNTRFHRVGLPWSGSTSDTGAGRYLSSYQQNIPLPRTNDVIDNQCLIQQGLLRGPLPAYRMYQRERC